MVTSDQCVFAWGETGKALGHETTSTGLVLWASDEQVTAAAQAEADGACFPEPTGWVKDDGSIATDAGDKEATSPQGSASCSANMLPDLDDSKELSVCVGPDPGRWLGASLELVSASPGCSVVLLQAPLYSGVEGESAVPLIKMRIQKERPTAALDHVRVGNS